MDMKLIKHNRIRKLVLEALSPDYPNPLDTLILRQTLSNMGYPLTEGEMTAYLAYLKERGYITVETRKGYDIVLAAITANGLDVLDGRIEDRGIGVDL